MTDIDGTDVDTTRSDVPGSGCREEGCPNYYESGAVARCGACDCVLQLMPLVGKNCPVAAEENEVEHSGAYGQAKHLFEGDDQ